MINPTEVEVKDEGVKTALAEHDLSNPSLVHTNLIAAQCVCVAYPDADTKRAVLLGLVLPGSIEGDIAALPAGQAFGQPTHKAGQKDGGTCWNCGGMTVQTGSCTECTECFVSSGGCG